MVAGSGCVVILEPPKIHNPLIMVGGIISLSKALSTLESQSTISSSAIRPRSTKGLLVLFYLNSEICAPSNPNPEYSVLLRWPCLSIWNSLS